MIKLIPMEEETYQKYLKISITEYAQEHVEAGNWQPSEAQAKAEQEFNQLLPDGLSSKDNYIYTVYDVSSNTQVGMIWFGVLTSSTVPRAFIYDFRIDEQHRRKGFATQALAAVEDKVLALGVKSIGLHVFGHNRAARALYEKASYQVTSLIMLRICKMRIQSAVSIAHPNTPYIKYGQ